MQHGKRNQANVHYRIGSQEFIRRYKLHDPRRAKPPHAKGCQRGREEIPCDFLRLMSEFLHILNEITPSAYLPTDVKKLRHHCHPEMWVAEEIAKMAVITTIFVFTMNGGEFRPENHQSPTDRDGAQY